MMYIVCYRPKQHSLLATKFRSRSRSAEIVRRMCEAKKIYQTMYYENDTSEPGEKKEKKLFHRLATGTEYGISFESGK